jgi:hypothetical protein
MKILLASDLVVTLRIILLRAFGHSYLYLYLLVELRTINYVFVMEISIHVILRSSF